MPSKSSDRPEWTKVAIISDLHSTFLDRDAFECFRQIYASHDFSQLIVNGDLVDLPMLSSHESRIEVMNPVIPKEYTLDEELDFTMELILKPLWKATKGKVPILTRIGNHDRRLIRALRTNARAVPEILSVAMRRRATTLEDLLHLDDFNATLSYKGVDFLWHRFALVHGSKTNATRCKMNFETYGPGTSGHVHKLGRFDKVTYFGTQQWVETGCLRTIKDIEYMDEGFCPGWQHGFVTVWFNKRTGEMFVKQHEIRNGRCEFGGQVYSA